MPELPEVESVRRGFEPYIVGRMFTSVEVLHPRANRGQEEPLAALVEGRTIAAAARRGKFMWLEFADEDLSDPARDVLFIHLGMSGQVRIGAVDSPHVRIRAVLDDATPISFVDQRTFGYWRVAPWLTMAHIAPDPLEPDFDLTAAARRIRAKKTAVKVALLDQTVVSGVGNIYADEALWAAGISPLKKANTLRQKDAAAIVRAAAEVMRAALDVGGTSFDALYVNVNGESGYFDRSLHAYGRGGQPCDRCGTELVKTVVGGRGTHYCPSCQRRGAA
ncbi:bifunctional DNA-formamidopyrimidine glycosylase/DNA-(apurinic or apyrimidinic site) lyase [Corynebacterium sp. FDAARGOS 1242]|uniref:bifunctional DNA-formamidopyrimidine glycosylase/DNA-(apurinic or apyrimidinic site) lyase n=1 Tax=Corynebacterium sp. FDAARGOS 1242 TaxID=2778078 RepID=UPI001950B540|nr:bifunctional DNA-formamidopyrimidine glycosylase/DNA-(apurinic or apyrimidinic site) lyase [Corynebacterium sp. FDAARGOS 1242]QRP98512.1 bifunctional DNA-formamidopyrimidine glycosylase/DNA-(apurinic or apyrimidinic site) lyase [Corynebacterium sp. FDAARGOS 1242]